LLLDISIGYEPGTKIYILQRWKEHVRVKAGQFCLKKTAQYETLRSKFWLKFEPP
jgi:hypothetical protein